MQRASIPIQYFFLIFSNIYNIFLSYLILWGISVMSRGIRIRCQQSLIPGLREQQYVPKGEGFPFRPASLPLFRRRKEEAVHGTLEFSVGIQWDRMPVACPVCIEPLTARAPGGKKYFHCSSSGEGWHTSHKQQPRRSTFLLNYWKGRDPGRGGLERLPIHRDLSRPLPATLYNRLP